MANIAEVINFPVPDVALKEPRVAELDDGYTRIANELLESIASADLTARQLKLMLAYIRKTYGFNKKSDRIADEQIAQITGLSRQNVNKAKKELISMNCLFLDGSKIGVNKEVSAWRFSKCLQVSNFVSKSETLNVSKLETSEVSKLETHKRHSLKTNKDNINKPPISPKKISPRFDPLSVELPDWLSAETWSAWVNYRKEIAKSIKSMQSVTMAINLLGRSREKGYTPEEIINQSIASGWQGIFEPKQPKGQSQFRTQQRAMTESFATKDYGQTEIPSWAQE
ncbi:TPA: replication protein [Citrobacter freundii]|nr:replication protein [Citrobacter freundii]